MATLEGARRFKNTITSIPYETLELNAGTTSREYILNNHGVDITPLDISEVVGLPAQVIRLAPSVYLGDLYEDGAPTVFQEEMPVLVSVEIDSETTQIILPASPIDVCGVVVDFGPTPQTVSDVCHDWVMESTEPYADTTIAKKFTRLHRPGECGGSTSIISNGHSLTIENASVVSGAENTILIGG